MRFFVFLPLDVRPSRRLQQNNASALVKTRPNKESAHATSLEPRSVVIVLGSVGLRKFCAETRRNPGSFM